MTCPKCRAEMRTDTVTIGLTRTAKDVCLKCGCVSKVRITKLDGRIELN